jgi:acyl-coenzyme A thioesterase PaaI-like protein
VGEKVGTGATVVKAGSRMVNEGSQGRRDGDLGDESEDAALRHKRNGTAEGYREAAMRTGWTCPGAGLFEPDDPVLSGKSKGGKYRPFAKHLPNAMSPYEPVETGGFISGREAVEERGIDLRLLWDCEGEKVVGVVRFDEAKAAIGPGYSVHGGAIQAVLDEATAEAGKMSAFPYLATRRIAHEIKKPVPCGTTLEVWTEVREIKGLRCFVAGEIRDPSAGTVYASAEAELVNMVPFLDRE